MTKRFHPQRFQPVDDAKCGVCGEAAMGFYRCGICGAETCGRSDCYDYAEFACVPCERLLPPAVYVLRREP